MIYFIKFIYNNFLLPPGIFIILLFLLSLKLCRKQPSIAKILTGIILIFYLCTTPLFSNSLMHSLESKYSPPSEVNGDVIVMLGGGATLDTPNIGGKGHLTGVAANRLLTCLQLYQTLHVPIIVSGGQVFEDTGREAEIARSILISLGIPEGKIILESKSLNTTENAVYTKKLLDKYDYQKPILVTSAFHMERAVKQFEKVNTSVIPYPTDYHINISNQFTLGKLRISADKFNNTSLALKEYLGLLALKWY